MGEHERAIEHGHQILRMNPRNARSYETYQLLGVRVSCAKQYAEGIRWALRALNEKPGMLQPHMTSRTVTLARTTSTKHALRSRQHKGSRQNTSSAGWRGRRFSAELRIAREQHVHSHRRRS